MKYNISFEKSEIGCYNPNESAHSNFILKSDESTSEPKPIQTKKNLHAIKDE